MELRDRDGLSTAMENRLDSTKEMMPIVGGVSEESDNDVEIQDAAFIGTKSTNGDAADMRRMGKDQELIRHFRQLSITSFLSLANPAWELGLFILSPALQNGGRPMLVWSLLCTPYPGHRSWHRRAPAASKHVLLPVKLDGIPQKWRSRRSSHTFAQAQRVLCSCHA